MLLALLMFLLLPWLLLLSLLNVNDHPHDFDGDLLEDESASGRSPKRRAAWSLAYAASVRTCHLLGGARSPQRETASAAIRDMPPEDVAEGWSLGS